jgi:hypothetical protein
MAVNACATAHFRIEGNKLASSGDNNVESV